MTRFRVIQMRPACLLKKDDEIEGFGVLTNVSLAPNHNVYVWTEADGRHMFPAQAMIPVVQPPLQYWERTITYRTGDEATAKAWRDEVGKTDVTTTTARVSTRTFGEVKELDNA